MCEAAWRKQIRFEASYASGYHCPGVSSDLGRIWRKRCQDWPLLFIDNSSADRAHTLLIKWWPKYGFWTRTLFVIMGLRWGFVFFVSCFINRQLLLVTPMTGNNHTGVNLRSELTDLHLKLLCLGRCVSTHANREGWGVTSIRIELYMQGTIHN